MEDKQTSKGYVKCMGRFTQMLLGIALAQGIYRFYKVNISTPAQSLKIPSPGGKINRKQPVPTTADPQCSILRSAEELQCGAPGSPAAKPWKWSQPSGPGKPKLWGSKETMRVWSCFQILVCLKPGNWTFLIRAQLRLINPGGLYLQHNELLNIIPSSPSFLLGYHIWRSKTSNTTRSVFWKLLWASF